MHTREEKLQAFGRILDVLDELREKCPWDRKQTNESLRPQTLEEVYELIRSISFPNNKAKHLIGMAKMLVNDFGGILPDTMEELLKFPGVGRKVANLLLGDVYHKGGTVADTHCIRICGRFGMYPQRVKDPHKVEIIMSELVEPNEQSDLCHRIVQFGRDVCSARSPKCNECPISHLCEMGRKAKNV